MTVSLISSCSLSINHFLPENQTVPTGGANLKHSRDYEKVVKQRQLTSNDYLMTRKILIFLSNCMSLGGKYVRSESALIMIANIRL